MGDHLVDHQLKEEGEPVPIISTPKKRKLPQVTSTTPIKQPKLTSSLKTTKPTGDKDLNTKTPKLTKPRAKPNTRAPPSKISKAEISDLFDHITAAVGSSKWAEIVNELNVKYGTSRRADNVRSHWNVISRGKLVGGYGEEGTSGGKGEA